MSILHIQLFENHGDEGRLARTDASAGAGTVYLTGDFDDEELAWWAKIGDLAFVQEPGLDFNRSLVSVFRVQHQDVVDIQKHQNTIA